MLLDHLEKLKIHIFMLEPPRISMLLQRSYMVNGCVNGYSIYVGQIGIIDTKFECLSLLIQQFYFQEYVEQKHLCADV